MTDFPSNQVLPNRQKSNQMKSPTLLLGILLLFACGNTAEKTTSEAVIPPDTEASPETASVSANNCTEMPFFQKGAEITAKTYNEKGEVVSTEFTRVLEVKEEGRFTIANVETVVSNPVGTPESTVSFSYKCDGKSLYFDLASMYRTEEKNQDPDFESTYFEYPISMKVGDVFPDLEGSMSSVKAGKKMIMTYHLINRKVESKEEITVPAGTWECFKITHELKVDMDIPGMDPKMADMMKQMQSQTKITAITWFSPEAGMVKSEVYQNGKLETVNSLFDIKQ